MRRSLRCTAVVLAVGLTLAGCSSKKKTPVASAPTSAAASTPAATPTPTPSEVATDGVELVRNASVKAEQAGTAKFVMTMKMTVPGQGDVTIRANGAQTLKAPLKARMVMKMAGGGQDMRFETIMTAKAMYMKFPKELAQQMGGKAWVKIVFADLKGLSGVDIQTLIDQSQQSGPTAYVKMLVAAGDVKEVGTETIRGEETTQYSGTVQPEDLTKAFTGDLRKQYSALLKQIGSSPIEMDIWVGADGLPRRLHQVMSFQGNEMDLSMDLYDFGTKVDVTPPPASKTTDLGKLLKKKG